MTLTYSDLIELLEADTKLPLGYSAWVRANGNILIQNNTGVAQLNPGQSYTF